MNPAFDDEDIFRQFDYHPPNNRSSNRNARQSVSKTELLEILDMVKSSLERAWFISCGGQRRKLKRMEALEELKQKIEACPDDMNLSMVLENTIAPTSIVAVSPPVVVVDSRTGFLRMKGYTFLNLCLSLATFKPQIYSKYSTII